MRAAAEGVIKFAVEHHTRRLGKRELEAVLPELLGWRMILHSLGLIGQSRKRYDGLGFGNVSARLPPFGTRPGRRAFVITGTQTGGKQVTTVGDLCVVGSYSYADSRVESRGLVLPSSEALTHAAIYDQSARSRFVFHVHAPVLWRAVRRMGLPHTRAKATYGTAAMALEVERLWRACGLGESGVLAMAGHQDGIVAWGPSARVAGAALLDAVARAGTAAMTTSTRPSRLPTAPRMSHTRQSRIAGPTL